MHVLKMSFHDNYTKPLVIKGHAYSRPNKLIDGHCMHALSHVYLFVICFVNGCLYSCVVGMFAILHKFTVFFTVRFQ